MTRESLRKHYERIMKAFEFTPDREIYQSSKMIIDLLNKTEWTPVTEGLPEEDTDVLVTVVKCRHKVMYAKYDRQLQKFCVGNYIRSKYVTAWMPLPEPYKAKSEVKE